MGICKSRLFFLSSVIFGGLCTATIFHATLRCYYNLLDPWRTFLFNGHARFDDWKDSLISVTLLNPYYEHGKAIANYFPFTYVLLLPASFMSKIGSISTFILTAAVLMTTALTAYYCLFLKPAIGRHSFRWMFAVVICIVCSYPLIFAIDRGNLECWVSLLCLNFVLLRDSRFSWAGALALALGIAIKGYPAAFLLLLIGERRYAESFLIMLLAGLLTFSAFFVLQDGVAHTMEGLRYGLHQFRETYVLGDASANFSVDPYNGIRIVFAWMQSWGNHGLITINPSETYLRIYDVLSLVFAGLSAFFVLFVPAPTWRRIMAVCLLTLLFPDVANDYKLLILLSGLFMLLVTPENGRREKYSLWCIALLFVPKQYYFIGLITVSTMISPVIVLALVWQVLVDGPAWRAGIQGFCNKVLWYLSRLGAVNGAGDDGDVPAV